MTVTVSQGRVEGFECLVLENSALRAVIIPTLGGRVWELWDRRRKRQWIWHREGVPLAACPPGSVYDDVWAGGWEELFPNDAPGEFEGRMLLDHGEWWCAPWAVTESASGGVGRVCLECESPLRGARCFKELRLGAEGGRLEVFYRIENPGTEAFHFLFKQHLPVAITPSCRLALPGGLVQAVDPSFGTVLPAGGPFAWPLAGGADLRLVPDRVSRAREFVYITDLPAGWCGVDDLASGASLRMEYQSRELPFVWLFLSYGGWQDCYTAVLEPCTNLPKDLAEAVRTGRSAYLPASGVFETRAAVIVSGLNQGA